MEKNSTLQREAFCVEAAILRVCLEPKEENWELLVVNDSQEVLHMARIELSAPPHIFATPRSFEFHNLKEGKRSVGKDIIVRLNQETQSDDNLLAFSVLYRLGRQRLNRVESHLPIPFI